MKNSKTTKNSLKNFQATIYNSQANDLEKLNEFEKFVFENQKHDLKTKSKLTIEKFSKENVFFDIFQKQNWVNKKYLQFNTQAKKQKLIKEFVNTFYFVNTPNEKNFEKKLIEEITNKIIIEYIKNSYNASDINDLENIEKTLENIEQLKEEIRKTAFENIEQQKQAKKEYRKTYQKEIQKQLKARYRLNKKYSFLID